MEFILSTPADESLQTLKNSLVEWSETLEIAEIQDNSNLEGKNFKIHICTQDPTIIFDTCARFGRIKSVKIDEQGR